MVTIRGPAVGVRLATAARGCRAGRGDVDVDGATDRYTDGDTDGDGRVDRRGRDSDIVAVRTGGSHSDLGPAGSVAFVTEARTRLGSVEPVTAVAVYVTP